ncbi:hypothetical protein GCM10018966_044690 [Streptomyces yanii]
MSMRELGRIGVVGCGLMGSGIAEVWAEAGPARPARGRCEPGAAVAPHAVLADAGHRRMGAGHGPARQIGGRPAMIHQADSWACVREVLSACSLYGAIPRMLRRRSSGSPRVPLCPALL